MDPYYHVGIVVESLEQASDELSNSVGYRFEMPREVELDGVPLRLAYSLSGPPFIELIERTPGPPFAALGIDHIGFWTGELDRDQQTIEAGGLRLELDGRPLGRRFSMNRAEQSGIRIELVDEAGRTILESRAKDAPPQS